MSAWTDMLGKGLTASQIRSCRDWAKRESVSSAMDYIDRVAPFKIVDRDAWEALVKQLAAEPSLAMERIPVAGESEADLLRRHGIKEDDLREIYDTAIGGRKINAIKDCRSVMGFTLKEAKDSVDRLEVEGITALTLSDHLDSFTRASAEVILHHLREVHPFDVPADPAATASNLLAAHDRAHRIFVYEIVMEVVNDDGLMFTEAADEELLASRVDAQEICDAENERIRISVMNKGQDWHADRPMYHYNRYAVKEREVV